MGQTCRQQSGRWKTHILAWELPTTFTRTTLVRLAISLSTKSWTRIGARPIGRRDLGDIYRRRPSAKLPEKESRYVGKLLEVYAETTGASICRRILPGRTTFKNSECASMNAEAFMVHYRDQTEPGTIEDLQSRFSMPSSLRFQFPNRRMGG